MPTQSRILIVGCGGIGGVIATKLNAAQTAYVSVVSTNQEIVDAVSKHGFRMVGVGGPLSTSGPIQNAIPDELFDFVVLATRPPQVEEAAKQALHALRTDGVMLVLQNGLCEPRVAEVVGMERTIGGIVSFGAGMKEPGLFELTARGGITLGHMGSGGHPKLLQIARLLAPLGRIETTQNLIGARYSKLALNCAVSGIGTVGGMALGPLLMHSQVRNLALSVMREVVLVSRAEGVKLEPIAGTFDLNWLANPTAADRGLTHWLRHAVLLIVGLKYRRLRSSMLRAIERGRSPAVGFLNGEIVERGERHQIATPFNRAIRDTVLRIAASESSSDLSHIGAIQKSVHKKA